MVDIHQAKWSKVQLKTGKKGKQISNINTALLTLHGSDNSLCISILFS